MAGILCVIFNVQYVSDFIINSSLYHIFDTCSVAYQSLTSTESFGLALKKIDRIALSTDGAGTEHLWILWTRGKI